MSHSMYRRRRWRTFATTLALTLGSLALPAAALADGQLDPTFNGTGYHVGTVAEGTVFNNSDTRIPMVVQANGRVVIGGSRGGFMTLARYNADGALDTTFGTGGFATAQFAGTPDERPGQQRRHRHDARTRPATSSSPASARRSRGRRALHRQRRLQRRGRLLRAAPDRLHGPRRRRRRDGASCSSATPATAIPRSPCRARRRSSTASAPSSRFRRAAVEHRRPAAPTRTTRGLSLGSAGVQIDGLGHDGTAAPDPSRRPAAGTTASRAHATAATSWRRPSAPTARRGCRALHGRRRRRARRHVQPARATPGRCRSRA